MWDFWVVLQESFVIDIKICYNIYAENGDGGNMKKKLLSIVLLICFTLLTACKNEVVNSEPVVINSTEEIIQVSEGAKMTSFEIETNSGVRYDINKAKKPILLNFWATWCGYCKQEMPDLQGLYEEYKDQVDFLMINSGESKDVADKYISKEGFSFPIGYDEAGLIANRFDFVGFPTTIIIDKNKNISNYLIGARNKSQFREYIEEVLK